jgi:predicted RNA-binding Zn ribbon-like protein
MHGSGHLHLDGVAPAFDLVNSEYWYGLGPLEDRLDSPRWCRGFLIRWGYGTRPDPEGDEYEVLVGLRGLLRRLVERPAPTAADIAALNRFMNQPGVRRLRHRNGEYELELRPVAAAGWRWIAASVAASFAEVLADGEWERVKVCANPDCRFAFYDETKNGSRRWCAQTICGNRFKGRRFRERAKERKERNRRPRPSRAS